MSVQLTNLRVTIQHRDILRDVSIFFEEGLTVLMGLNGSGKSSLLKALYGAWPYTGSATFKGEELQRLPSRRRARLLAVAHQEQALMFPLPVFDFVLAGRFPALRWLETFSASDKSAARQALARFGIADLSDRPFSELSGGERQKALLARLWLQDTPVWLLDEPDLNLDPRSLSELYHLLREEAGAGRVLVCASHDLGLARAPFVKKVVGLRQGAVVWDEPLGGRLEAFLESVFGPWPAHISPDIRY